MTDVLELKITASSADEMDTLCERVSYFDSAKIRMSFGNTTSLVALVRKWTADLDTEVLPIQFDAGAMNILGLVIDGQKTIDAAVDWWRNYQ